MVLVAALLALPGIGLAASGRNEAARHWTGGLALALFAVGYLLVIFEDRVRLRKSIPMILAAGALWTLVALSPIGPEAEKLLRVQILEFAELFLFILAAVTYVNTLEERQVFDALRAWILRKGLTYRGVFWATGAMAFAMSPIADNLTTTLVMGGVAISVGRKVPRFVVPACINIVVAANAGGSFSPFGDITTLMVWQSGKLGFGEFFILLIPALVNWLIPAAIMAWAIPSEKPELDPDAEVGMLPGARAVIALFLGTIALTIVLHNALGLPSALGMMTGFGVLHLYSKLLRRALRLENQESLEVSRMLGGIEEQPRRDSFDVFGLLARVEWDTLMFFYGVILCVGALGAFGLLDAAAKGTYGAWGPTGANTFVGGASAIFDNIPLMAAILSVSPDMNKSQWLLVTLTAGVGGSLLSLGSAAGVALMGQARGVYTFTAHLRWTWAIAIGYAASILTHLMISGR